MIRRKNILLKLFPRIRMYYRTNDLEDSYQDWKYNFRICTTEFFYNYFTLNLDAEDLSVTSIDELFKLDNVEKISEMFLEYDRNNQTKELFDIIINRMRDIPKENAHYFINSLIDIGDQLHIPINMFFDKRVYLSRILDDLLKKYDVRITDENFAEAIKIKAVVKESQFADVENEIMQLTAGKGKFPKTSG